MQPWRPASPFEEQLAAAHAAEDTYTCLSLMRTTEFALPITAAAAAGEEAPRWATADRADGVWLIAYTSVESMATGTGGAVEHCRVQSLVEIAAAWPDLEWGLAVNPGLPVQLLMPSGLVARLAAPAMAEEQSTAPDQVPALVQKVIPYGDLNTVFATRNGRVSGYVHSLADVRHMGSPNVLLDALGRMAEEDVLIDDEGSTYLMRWPAIGPDLYRSPYGGTTERACAAVEGWVIEEPPFIGTGLVPNVEQAIREYKVDGICLPHRAEIVQVTRAGQEHLVATWDGDRGAWMVRVRPPASGELG